MIIVHFYCIPKYKYYCQKGQNEKSAIKLIGRNIFIILKSLSLKYEKKMHLKFRFSLMKSRFYTLKT